MTARPPHPFLAVALAAMLTACGQEQALYITSDIERGEVLINQKAIGEIRAGYIRALTRSGKHHVEVKKSTPDGKWLLLATAEVDVPSGPQPVHIELKTQKQAVVAPKPADGEQPSSTVATTPAPTPNPSR